MIRTAARCFSGSMLPRTVTRLRINPSSLGAGGSSTIQPPPNANVQLSPDRAGAVHADNGNGRIGLHQECDTLQHDTMVVDDEDPDSGAGGLRL